MTALTLGRAGMRQTRRGPLLQIAPTQGAATSLTARIGGASAALVHLRNPLPAPDLRLRSALVVRLWWDEVAGVYVAGEEALRQWYGVGASPNAALADLAEVLVELFRDLSQDVEQLGPALRQDFERLSRVIAYADQDA